MQIKNINLVYFSATFTTRKVARAIAEQLQTNVTEFDITQNSLQQNIKMSSDELLIVAMPVYFGRIPALAVENLKKLSGTDTPAIMVAVYGNRAYDDALLEIKDIITPNGFRPISAGAFVAQHSIFPDAAKGRPDASDMEKISAFGKKNAEILKDLKDSKSLSDLKVPGNRPYHPIGKIPFYPTGNENCKGCGECASQCPVQAISKENPKETDTEKCISCGRCIVVCPQHARHFTGEVYEGAKTGFLQSYSAHKEIETFYIK